MYFLLFRIFDQLALALKNSVPWIHCIEYIVFIIQEFWATCACPEIFHCIEIYFIIQDFWATCACPEKQSCPEISLYWNIFYNSGFLSNSRLPSKTELPSKFSLFWICFLYSEFLSNLRLPCNTELPWNFSLYWNVFYHSGIMSNLHLSWKQSLPWNFSSPGSGRPAPPPRTPMAVLIVTTTNYCR